MLLGFVGFPICLHGHFSNASALASSFRPMSARALTVWRVVPTLITLRFGVGPSCLESLDDSTCRQESLGATTLTDGNIVCWPYLVIASSASTSTQLKSLIGKHFTFLQSS
jgi:hypothetical protein